VKIIQNPVKMPVMHRPPKPLARAVLQQMGKLMATGMGQQIKRAQLSIKIPPLLDFPARQPATGGFRPVLGLNHPRTIGDLVLPAMGIKPVIGRLARTYAANKFTAGRRPENLFGNGAHQFAECAGVL
jgi:hypothetical protein